MPRLTLFPLNTVLFPGMQLKLHIFEERYKLMINRCIEEKEQFGVVLIQQGQEALGPAAVPHGVGCAAAISEVQRLPQERMNIVAVGQRRFRIKSVDRALPYLVGDVEFFLPRDDQPQIARRYVDILRPMLIRYLEAISSSDDTRLAAEQMPRSPRAVAQIASILLQCENLQKQELLAMDSLSRLLVTLVETYRLETALLDVRLSPPGDDFNIGPFSSN